MSAVLLDPDRGVRQFVVGTDGGGLRPMGSTILPHSEVRQATADRVLRLVLGEGAYEWEFVPIAGQSFSDPGQRHLPLTRGVRLSTGSSVP